MVTLLTWVLVAASPASCRALYQDLRYKEAIAECQTALGTAAPDEAAELYRLLALSYAAAGDHANARLAFIGLLTVDPAAALSGEYAPRIRADFSAAREAGAGAPVKLAVKPATPLVVGKPLELEVTVDDGPAAPVSVVQVRAAQGNADVARGPAMHASLPAVSVTGPLALELIARDVLGGRLTTRATSVDVVEPPQRGLLLRWPLWGGVAVGLGVAGGAFGLVSRSRGSDALAAPFADDRLRLQNEANGWAIAADVGLGLAVVFLVTSVVLLLTAH